MSAKGTWNAHTVLRIFYPRPVSEALMRIYRSSPPPLYNVESVSRDLSYLE